MPENQENAPEERPDRVPRQDKRTGGSAAAARMQHQSSWVDQQIRVAMAKGDFDDLPGAGKPIRDLGATHDPDWWLKKLIEREQVSGVLPPSLALRKDDAELDDLLDRSSAESEARREVEDFNARVMRARYTPTEGPPLITQPRDVEQTLEAWAQRRTARIEAARTRTPETDPAPPTRRRRWWSRS